MNVKFSFDNAAVERKGYTLEDVRQTIKSLFIAYGLPCVSDGDALAFKDKDHVCALCGGFAAVESVPGVETTFYLSFPQV